MLRPVTATLLTQHLDSWTVRVGGQHWKKSNSGQKWNSHKTPRLQESKFRVRVKMAQSLSQTIYVTQNKSVFLDQIQTTSSASSHSRGSDAQHSGRRSWFTIMLLLHVICNLQVTTSSSHDRSIIRLNIINQDSLSPVTEIFSGPRHPAAILWPRKQTQSEGDAFLSRSDISWWVCYNSCRSGHLKETTSHFLSVWPGEESFVSLPTSNLCWESVQHVDSWVNPVQSPWWGLNVTWWRLQQWGGPRMERGRGLQCLTGERMGTWAYIAQGLVRSSNTVGSSMPRANSLINWQCTLTSIAVWVRISPSQFQLL